MPLKGTAVTTAPMPESGPPTEYPKYLVKMSGGQAISDRIVKNAAEEKSARAEGYSHPHDKKGAY